MLPVKGSEAVVEVFVPAGAKAEVEVESVAHHYAGLAITRRTGDHTRASRARDLPSPAREARV